MELCLNHLLATITKNAFVDIPIWKQLKECELTIAKNHSQSLNLKTELITLVKDPEFVKSLETQFYREAEAKNRAWRETHHRLVNMKSALERRCKSITANISKRSTVRVIEIQKAKLKNKQEELADVVADIKSLGKEDDPEKITLRKNMAGIPKWSVTRWNGIAKTNQRIFKYRGALRSQYKLEVSRQPKKTREARQVIYKQLRSAKIAIAMATFTDLLAEPSLAQTRLQTDRKNAGADLTEIDHVREAAKKLEKNPGKREVAFIKMHKQQDKGTVLNLDTGEKLDGSLFEAMKVVRIAREKSASRMTKALDQLQEKTEYILLLDRMIFIEPDVDEETYVEHVQIGYKQLCYLNLDLQQQTSTLFPELSKSQRETKLKKLLESRNCAISTRQEAQRELDTQEQHDLLNLEVDANKVSAAEKQLQK